MSSGQMENPPNEEIGDCNEVDIMREDGSLAVRAGTKPQDFKYLKVDLLKSSLCSRLLGKGHLGK
jgi:hypothetical protein